MNSITLVLFVLGLVVLIIGAEMLIRGASRLATAIGISPLVVGLTVVAFGTSSPELAVMLQSTTAGQADLAVGNIVGSNIANVLLILGIAAVITPLVVDQQLLRLDVPLLIVLSFLMLILALDGVVGRLDGLLLLSIAVGYTVFAIRQSRRESQKVKDEYAREYGAPRLSAPGQVGVQIALIVAGLTMLVTGARWLVEGAVAMAQVLGVSELIIGLTVIAVGTSLPEIATTIVASLRGERDIAVGNAIGSNILNITVVLGLTSLVAPQGVPVAPAALGFDIPVMIAVAIACLPIFFIGGAITRGEGIVFLAYYLAYTGHLVLQASAHGALPGFNTFMLVVALPLTAITLVVLTARTLRAKRRHVAMQPLDGEH